MTDNLVPEIDTCGAFVQPVDYAWPQVGAWGHRQGRSFIVAFTQLLFNVAKPI